MLGLSLSEALKAPTAPGGPWVVCGVARRALPTWFNSTLLDHYVELDILDSEATKRELSPLSIKITHIFWLLRKACETEDENVIVNTKMVENVLKVLVPSTVLSPKLCHFTLVTGTKQNLGPIFDPILSSKTKPQESPFVEEMPRLSSPNFYYNLEDLLASYSPKFTWSIHRSSVILGASRRSAHNNLLTFVVYALICKHEGSPFRFPGGKFMWEHFFDASDAKLLADQQIWAALSDKAKGEAFNCTNGDIFTWKSFWKLLCEIVGVEFMPFDETDEYNWVEDMKGKGSVWDAIVEENKLVAMKLEEFSCFDACQIVLDLKIQHVCSMTKSREFGFDGFVDTFKSVGGWVEKLKEMNIIPKHL